MKEVKSILLISNAFYPEISPRSFRAAELAREFAAQGHKVTVLTRDRGIDYIDLQKEMGIEIKIWSRQRLPVLPRTKWRAITRAFEAFNRLLLILFEYPAIEDMFKVRKKLKRENNYDLMISFAVPYPVHWGTAWSRTKEHFIAKKWIADCGDPYMGDILDSFRKMFYFKYLEKWFCRKSDFISIPVESAKPAYYKEFHSKIVIIPQGFKFDTNIEKDNFVKNRIPEFSYAGGFLPGARDPRPLLDYLSNKSLPFKFFIFTNSKELLEGYIPILGEKMVISEYIQRDNLIQTLSKMDFLINFDNNTELNVPSKLIDYSIANRPVLNIKREMDLKSIDEFLEGNYSNRMQLPDPTTYHISNIANKFLALVD